MGYNTLRLVYHIICFTYFNSLSTTWFTQTTISIHRPIQHKAHTK